MIVIRQFKHINEHLLPALQELAAVAPAGPVALRLAAALAYLPASRLRRARRRKARARPASP